MRKNENPNRGYGLFQNLGWKKNLAAVAAGFLLSLILENLEPLILTSRLMSTFDVSVAIVPLIGFTLGIWGVIGCLLEYFIFILPLFFSSTASETMLSASFYAWSGFGLMVYCSLPVLLWYALPLKGEKKAVYPRLDTSSHVIKYYLIMVVNVAVYIVIIGVEILIFGRKISISNAILLDLATTFTQYLDIILILGIPIIIIISLVRNRSLTINEQMVLAFLVIGVIASGLGSYLVYRTVLHLDPGLFQDYEKVVAAETVEDSIDYMAIIERYNTFWNWFYVMMAIMLNSLLVIEMLFMRSIERRITKPILHLKDVLTQYTRYGDGGLDPETVREKCLPYQSGYGEVSSLTQTCVNMVDKIDHYTDNLQTVTAEKERIGTELSVASKIQGDMLPRIFPPFPDRSEIDLYASMTPAKEVGGDFYDFYLVDRDHLVLTIADVSGKGVPAALFMVISKTLLKNHAQTGDSPKKILTYVNHQLCQNNASFMFCTVWLGILDLRNGKLTAANAGHEYPALKRKNGMYELIRGRHDPPLGIRDGFRYHEYELMLSSGDCLFEYTDGVTEAENESHEQFQEERLLQALNSNPDETTQETINTVYKAIQTFIQSAPQYDDITMLNIRYCGSEGSEGEEKREKLTVKASVESLGEVTRFAEEHLEAIDCSPDDMFALSLAVEEIFVNVAEYAYEGGEGLSEVEFYYDENQRMAEFVFLDSGIPFDPTSLPSPDITLRPEERQIGGLGIHIVKKTMDEVLYSYSGGRNMLTIRKHI